MCLSEAKGMDITMRYKEQTIEGRNAVLEAFRSGKTIDKLYILDGCQDGSISNIKREARRQDTIINFVTKERLDQLYKLSRKYGETEEEMIAYLENAQKELDEIAFSEERTEALHGERRELVRKIKALAVTLSEVRRQSGELFTKQVEEELAYLDMPHVHFLVRHEQVNPGRTARMRLNF